MRKMRILSAVLCLFALCAPAMAASKNTSQSTSQSAAAATGVGIGIAKVNNTNANNNNIKNDINSTNQQQQGQQQGQSLNSQINPYIRNSVEGGGSSSGGGGFISADISQLVFIVFKWPCRAISGIAYSIFGPAARLDPEELHREEADEEMFCQMKWQNAATRQAYIDTRIERQVMALRQQNQAAPPPQYVPPVSMVPPIIVAPVAQLAPPPAPEPRALVQAELDRTAQDAWHYARQITAANGFHDEDAKAARLAAYKAIILAEEARKELAR